MNTRRLSKLQLDDYGYNALGDYVDRNRPSIAINRLRHDLADGVVYRLRADARRLIASPRAVERWIALMRWHAAMSGYVGSASRSPVIFQRVSDSSS